MGFFDRPYRFVGAILIGLTLCGAAKAADYPNSPPPPPLNSVPCDVGWAGWHTLLPAYWTSAWLGHFSGGISHYDRDRGVEALVWGDEKRCFPTHRACSVWLSSLRRHYHHPAGYWTCMPLR